MANPNYPATDLNTGLKLFIPASNQIHDIVNGTASQEVTTDSGKIPSIRKMLADNMAFKAEVLPWTNGDNETDFRQLRLFDGVQYFAGTATDTNPIPMGTTPIGDTNWAIAPTNFNQELFREDIKKAAAETLEKSLGVNSRIWPKDRDLQVGDVIPSVQETSDGLPITHLVVNGNVYAMSPIASGVVSELVQDSVKIGAETVLLVSTESITVDNVATLKTFGLSAKKAKTAGYYSAGDGGGAEYVYSSEPHSVDNFLVLPADGGGFWLLNDDRVRLPAQVAGVKLNDFNHNNLSSLLAILGAKRPIYLSGEMVVDADQPIDLAPFISNQELLLDIEGNGVLSSSITFVTGDGGLISDVFFRGLRLNGLQIKNASQDKSGCGISINGAELVDIDNFTTSGWRCGANIHAWNSSIKNIASRNCYFAGSFYGTSQSNASMYAKDCDVSWAFGAMYTGGSNGNLALPNAGLALSYTSLESIASDDSGPFVFGRCFNIDVSAIGAERCKSSYIFDMSLYDALNSRQSVAVSALDLYIQSDDTPVAVFSPVTNVYGSLSVENTRLFSDKNIPMFSGDGRGFILGDVRYNSARQRPLTSGETNGLTMRDKFTVGSDPTLLSRTGFNQGGYNELRNIKAMTALKVSATSKIVFRLQDSAVTGIAQGITCFGEVTLFPAHKGGNNTSRECGKLIFSTAADFLGGLGSINLQKIGNINSVSASTRVNGSVTELVIQLDASVQFFANIDVWKNGNFASNFVDYYTDV